MKIDSVPFTDLLSDIIDNRGKTCPVDDYGVFPLIATNCISNDRLYPTYETQRWVSRETYNAWFRGHPLPGDIIFVCKGSPGRVAMAPDPVDFCIAQDMVSIRADTTRIYPRYLFAALRSAFVQSQIEGLHVGTLIPHFKKGDFNKLSIPVPTDREIQRSIGDVYFDLSAKIENNRRTAKLLEQTAQAIFKAWFVEFEPIKAKIAGSTSFPSMSQGAFDSLPTSFVESRLGLIPEGWAINAIEDVVSIFGGGTPSTKVDDYWIDGTNCWATPRDLSRLEHPLLLDTERHITEVGVGAISSGLLPSGTVLMSSRAPVGYLAIAGVPVAINQGFIAMVCDGPLPSTYILNWTHFAMGEIQARASGTTFPEISKKNFRPLAVLTPPAPIVESFQQSVDPCFGAITTIVKESSKLEEMRDYLLSKLISGEVRFS